MPKIMQKKLSSIGNVKEGLQVQDLKESISEIKTSYQNLKAQVESLNIPKEN